MALINCPECGKAVSESAESCPFCGYIIKENVLRKKLSLQQERVQKAHEEYKAKKDKLIEEYSTYNVEKPNIHRSLLWLLAFLIWAGLTALNILTTDSPGLTVFSLVVAIITGCTWLKYLCEDMAERKLYKKDFETYKKDHSSRIPLSSALNKEIEKKLQPEYDLLMKESDLLSSLEKEYYPPTKKTSTTTTTQDDTEIRIPRCPLCNSTRIRHISTVSRAISVATVGMASGKIGKQFECLDCQYKW